MMLSGGKLPSIYVANKANERAPRDCRSALRDRQPKLRAAIEPLENRALLAAGDIDPTFGSGGQVVGAVALPPSGLDENFSVGNSVRLADGKTLVVTTFTRYDTQGNSTRYLHLNRLLTGGTIDQSFGAGRGIVYELSRLGVADAGEHVQIDAAGRIFVSAGGEDTFGVIRFLANGRLDATFGSSGVTQLLPRGGEVKMRVMADGRVVLATTQFVNDPAIRDRFLAARFTPDGILDTSFDGDGLAHVNFGKDDDRLLSLALGEDASVYLGGVSNEIVFINGIYYGTANSKLALAKLTPTGVLDATFSGDGRSTFELIPGFGNFGIRGMHIDGQLRVSFATLLNRGAVAEYRGHLAICRITNDGSFDPTFGGGDGIFHSDEVFPIDAAELDRTSADNREAELLVLPIGPGVRVVGKAKGVAGRLLELRLTGAGALDRSFHPEADWKSLDLPPSQDALSQVIHRYSDAGNGRIALQIAPGFDGWALSSELGVAFVTSNLTLDSAFGPDGVARLAVEVPPSDVEVDANGRLLSAHALGSGYIAYAWRADGSPDTWLTGDGRAVFGFGTFLRDAPQLLAVGDGSTVVRAPLEASGDPYGFGVATLARNGSTQIEERWYPFEYLLSATRLPGGGYRFYGGRPDYYYFGSDLNASQLAGFGRRIDVELPLPAFQNRAKRYARSSAAFFVGTQGAHVVQGTVLYGDGPTNPDGILVPYIVRYRPDGSLDRGFDGDGILRGFAHDIVAAQSDGKLLYFDASGLRRLDTAGQTDSTFGTGGAFTTTLRSLEMDSLGRIILYRWIGADGARTGVEITRLTPDGKIDRTFGGGDGVVSVNLPWSSGDVELIVDDNNRVVMTAIRGGLNHPEWFATRLQAGSAATLMGDRSVYVPSSTGVDQINIATVGNVYRVTINGIEQTFSKTAVGKFIIEGYGGGDVITISNSVTINATIDAGDGSDRITGGGGNDLIVAGGGDDSIVAGAGNDIVRGDAGADRVEGNAGNDSITGGDGDDALFGGSGNDTLTGDAGADLIHGQDGNDLLRARDGRRDTLHGGSGFDRADRDEIDLLANVEQII